MFRAITGFELKYHLKGALFYILLLVYFLLSFLAVTTDGVRIGGALGNIHRNAPFVIMQFMLLMSIFGVLTTTAFVANAIHRDFELGTDSIFFSYPLKKSSYLGGRFTGSLITAVGVYAGVALAVVIGSLMPWIEKEQLGPFSFEPYLFSIFALVLPNLLLVGAIFFTVAALTRSLMATYASVVAFFVLYGVTGTLLGNMENERLASLLDPFGIGAFAIATRYWTVFDKNTKLLPLTWDSPFVWNRILWIGIALVVLAAAFYFFRFETGTRKASKKARRAKLAEAPPTERIALALPAVTQSFSTAGSWKQFLAKTKLHTVGVLTSIPFVIMTLLGMAMIWGNSTDLGALFGTNTYPVTHLMVEVIFGAFAIFAMLIAAFYAGDIVWRERTLKMHEVHDALPTPTWVIWGSKITALIIVVFTTLLFATLTAMLIQAGSGYFNFEPAVYFKGVFLQIGTWLLLIAAMSFLMQTYFNQKMVGFLGVMAWFIITRVLPAIDWEHRLYRFASIPPSTYSDMNGFGHFVKGMVWYNAYWLLLVAAALVIGHLFWVRGTESSWRPRMRIAAQRFGKPAAALLVLFLVAFISTGCYIYYNTNVLNDYETTKEGERKQAETEQRYKKFQYLAQPRITAVQADVDIFPERRAVEIRGSYTLVNKTQQPISELHVVGSPTLETFEIDVPAAKLKMNDRDRGYSIYTLARPLAPGASTTMKFRTGWDARGFVNGTANNSVVENGTFINSGAYFPHLGYQEFAELQDRNKRRKYGLQPIERMKPATDMQARMDNQISRDADWISLDTTVSTSADQTALAPGYLQKEWRANGRRYFHYKTTSPILSFWSYLSARYEVKRGEWKGIPIEIYYHARHPYNVDRMIYAVQKSLDYFTKNFSPYQHKQVRILEFPRYETFAQSFPNTIPYSESIGFIADLRDQEEIDYVFYITAHEIAHQWWAHQVIGGNVQGSTMIVETMAQYSALMVMEKEYGRAKMQKFLRFELDRYLRDRGSEVVAEMPLVQVENQGYIHYRKGSLVMYALRDYIGEEKVNAALAKFIRDHGFAGPPYPTAAEMVKYFREVTPPEYQPVITDLFETITIFDNRAREASVKELPGGRYQVTVTVEATKFRSDAKGEDKPIAIGDWIDVGVLAKANPEAKNDDVILALEKKRITKPVETFTFVVRQKPTRAGIDPLNKLIDRNPRDNTKAL
ncbi:MAG TPA: M1 family aminopeptidase [Thermoanaerobaculia bacterium]|jgi:ABC-type transport system involved in multi-copper enzyme maturation permease subunit